MKVINDRFERVLICLISNSKRGYNRRRILKLINSHPSNANQIACELKLHYKTVLHHPKVLSNYKLVMTYNMESYGAVYFLTPIMEKNYYYLFLEIFSELGKKEKNYTSPSRKDLNV